MAARVSTFVLLACLLSVQSAQAQLVFSAGFTDDAVFQRSATQGASVYGFTSTSQGTITVEVVGTSGNNRIFVNPLHKLTLKLQDLGHLLLTTSQQQ